MQSLRPLAILMSLRNTTIRSMPLQLRFLHFCLLMLSPSRNVSTLLQSKSLLLRLPRCVSTLPITISRTLLKRLSRVTLLRTTPVSKVLSSLLLNLRTLLKMINKFKLFFLRTRLKLSKRKLVRTLSQEKSINMEMLIFPLTDKNSFLLLRMLPGKLSSFRLMLMEN